MTHTALMSVATTRLMIVAVAMLAVTSIGYDSSAPPPPVSDSEFLNLPARWDAGWYVGIASGGYRWDGRPDHFQNIAFFPAYPLILGGVARALRVPVTNVAWLWTGVALSVLFFWLALLYVYRLSSGFGADAAHTAVRLTASYPFAIFFGLPYTEALFLLGVTAAFYHFRRGQLVYAVLWGGLVGLTRANGWLLSASLVALTFRRGAESREAAATRREMLTRLLAAAAPIAGMLMYSAYIWMVTGSPFMWASAQAAWGRVLVSPVTTLSSLLDAVTAAGVGDYMLAHPADILNGLAAAGALACVPSVTRRLGVAEGLFVAVNLVPPLVMGGLMSVGRFTSVLFPVFVWLGVALPANHRTTVLYVFATGQAIVTALFFTWRPLY